MFILSSISRSLEFWSLNHTLIHEESELKGFKNIKVLDKISNNLPKDLFGVNILKSFLNHVDDYCWWLMLQ